MAGKAVIISAPSGAGKTTLVRHLIARGLDLSFSVSACSRDPRGQEVHGKDYYFLGVAGFKEQIAADALLEWEEVYPDQFYGTLKSEIERIWADGKHVIFDVDVVGGLNLKQHFGDQALSIFIQPPSLETLRERLESRQTESAEKVAMRVAKAGQEMESAKDFDRIIVNKDLPVAQQEITQVVQDFISAS